MTNKTRTELEFVAKGRGFEEQKRKADALVKAINPQRLGKGFDTLDKLMGRNIRRMRDMDKAVQAMSKGFEGFGRAVEKVDKLLERMEKRGGPGAPGGPRGPGGAGGGAGGMPGTTGPARGAFSQGFAQAMGFGPFLQRGPGMTRQAAGMAVGGMARSPFAGAAGLTQGLANIPGFGLLAGPVQAALQGTSQNLALRRQEMDIMALGGGMGAARDARSAAASAAMGRPEFGAEVMMGKMEANLANARREATRRGGTGALPGTEKDLRRFFQAQGKHLLPPHVGTAQGILEGIPGQQGKMTPDFKREMDKAIAANPNIRAERQAITDRTIEETMKKASADFEQARQKAGAGAGAAAFSRQMLGGGLQGLGVGMGMNIQDTRTAQLQVLRAGGGTAADTGAILPGALGAQRAFGIDLQTGGQFLRAQRQGGIAGVGLGERAGGDLLAEALTNAMMAGLEGAELGENMARVAQGIQAFQQTGIPVADQAISKMTRGFAMASAAGPARAGRISESVVQRAQRIASTGAPQDALDMLLMQQAGGLTGGSKGFVKGMGKLAQGDIGGFGGLQALIRGGVGGPGLGAGASEQEKFTAIMGIQGLFRKLGAGFIDESQAELLRKSISGEDVNKAEAKEQKKIAARFQSAQKRVAEASSGEALRRSAVDRTAGSLQRQAALENDRLNKTRALVATSQKLEESQNNLLHAVEKLEPLTKGTADLLESVTATLPQLVEAIKWFVDWTGVNQSVPVEGGPKPK
jgi:hypothetical protein